MTAMQYTLTDFATALFISMSVAFGPAALIWMLVWTAQPGH
jgi:hypothetical protein